MKYDKLLAGLALVVFVAFLGVLALRVPHLDLQIVIGVTILLVLYDMWTEFARMRRK